MGSDVTKAVGISTPKFKAPASLEKIDSANQVSESASDVKKKQLKPKGRESALLAGLANALKTRLGQ